jgi:hypothetical protein
MTFAAIYLFIFIFSKQLIYKISILPKVTREGKNHQIVRILGVKMKDIIDHLYVYIYIYIYI